MYVVILAGGGGTRLWPLSTPARPKPFLPLLGDRSLLQMTFDRVVRGPELGIGADDVYVVTDRHYVPLVREQLPGIRAIAEPTGRNTAAAIALATIVIDRPEDDVMLVLPADHLIEREDVFRGVLAAAVNVLATGAFGIDSPLVTLGIQPGRVPSTDYGYLIPVLDRGDELGGLRAYPLRAFEEKPNEFRARDLLDVPGVAWNAGMFAWRRRAIRDALERYTGLLTLLRPFGNSDSALAAAYDRIKPTSIDYAVMEGAARDGQVVMAGMDVGWSDLGSWTALLAALGGTGSGRVVQAGESAEADATDLIIERANGRLVAEAGPRSILASSPTALIGDEAGSRTAVDALLHRVSAQEATT